VESVGALWHEIKGGAWHATDPISFESIVRDGAIKPGLIDPRLKKQGLAPCFSAQLGGVSVFDFLEAKWSEMSNHQPFVWCQFFNGYRSTEDNATGEKIAYAIEINRNLAPGWRTVEETRLLWREWLDSKRCPGNLVPRHETCHIGPIPLFACIRAIEIKALGGRVLSYEPVSSVGTSG
jgi:hypothetical protein